MTNPKAEDVVVRKLSQLWHEQVGLLISRGLAPALVRESMFAAAMVQAAHSEGAASVVDRLRNAADAFERDLLSSKPRTAPSKSH